MSGFTVKIEKTTGVLDNVTAVLNDSTIDLMVNAVALKYGWTESLGITKSRFFTDSMMRWAFAVAEACKVECDIEAARVGAVAEMAQAESAMAFEEPQA